MSCSEPVAFATASGARPAALASPPGSAAEDSSQAGSDKTADEQSSASGTASPAASPARGLEEDLACVPVSSRA